MYSILIIDDSEDMLMIQELALTRAGYKVWTSKGAEDALKKIGSLRNVDLILLDVQMDEVNGPDLLKKVQAEFPEIYATVPVVFVTAQSEPPSAKAAGWIRKMTNLDDFVASVEKFLGQTDTRIQMRNL